MSIKQESNIKNWIKIEYYENWKRFKTDGHDVPTTKVNKIALSSNDNKRMQTLDCRKTLSYETSIKKWKINYKK